MRLCVIAFTPHTLAHRTAMNRNPGSPTSTMQNAQAIGAGRLVFRMKYLWLRGEDLNRSLERGLQVMSLTRSHAVSMRWAVRARARSVLDRICIWKWLRGEDLNL
jgi:hypothetical protein